MADQDIPRGWGSVKTWVGRTFGRYEVIAYEGVRGKASYLTCRCECGTIKSVQSGALRHGTTVSCGCYAREATAKRSTIHGFTANKNMPPEYKSWDGMVQRCENPNDKDFPSYGGRGIKIHTSIRSFEDFIAYMGPSNGMTLERIKVNGDYEPGNIKWIEQAAQARNKRLTVHVNYAGYSIILEDGFNHLGTSQEVYYRLRREGKSAQEAFDAATP